MGPVLTTLVLMLFGAGLVMIFAGIGYLTFWEQGYEATRDVFRGRLHANRPDQGFFAAKALPRALRRNIEVQRASSGGGTMKMIKKNDADGDRYWLRKSVVNDLATELDFRIKIWKDHHCPDLSLAEAMMATYTLTSNKIVEKNAKVSQAGGA